MDNIERLVSLQRAWQKGRRESLVGMLLPSKVAEAQQRFSRANPERAQAVELAIRDAFELADAVIAESDRREKDGE